MLSASAKGRHEMPMEEPSRNRAFRLEDVEGKTMQQEQAKVLERPPSGVNGNGNGDSSGQLSPEPLGVHSNFATKSQSAFEPILDTEEAANLLKIHPKTLQKLARKGRIPGFRIGKLWGFRASALNRWLENTSSP